MGENKIIKYLKNEHLKNSIELAFQISFRNHEELKNLMI